MENNPRKKLIADTRRWVKQEQVWDDVVYASGKGERRDDRKSGSSVTAGSPERQREVFLSTNTTPRSYGHPASTVPRLYGTPPSSSQKAAALHALYEKYNTCVRCPLGNSRLKFVFGVGNPDAAVLLIGEGDQLLKVMCVRVFTSGFPRSHRSAGDSQKLSKIFLRQPDSCPQRKHHLPKRVVLFTI